MLGSTLLPSLLPHFSLLGRKVIHFTGSYFFTRFAYRPALSVCTHHTGKIMGRDWLLKSMLPSSSSHDLGTIDFPASRHDTFFIFNCPGDGDGHYKFALDTDSNVSASDFFGHDLASAEQWVQMLNTEMANKCDNSSERCFEPGHCFGVPHFVSFLPGLCCLGGCYLMCKEEHRKNIGSIKLIQERALHFPQPPTGETSGLRCNLVSAKCGRQSDGDSACTTGAPVWLEVQRLGAHPVSSMEVCGED